MQTDITQRRMSNERTDLSSLSSAARTLLYVSVSLGSPRRSRHRSFAALAKAIDSSPSTSSSQTYGSSPSAIAPPLAEGAAVILPRAAAKCLLGGDAAREGDDEAANPVAVVAAGRTAPLAEANADAGRRSWSEFRRTRRNTIVTDAPMASGERGMSRTNELSEGGPSNGREAHI